MSDAPRGTGPLAGVEPFGGPIDDPALADRANPRWADPTSPEPDAQSLSNPDGSPNVLPPRADHDTDPDPSMSHGEPRDQAARPLAGRAVPGDDNIRAGIGDGAANPSLAEGGSG